MVAPARLARVAKLEKAGGTIRPKAIGIRAIAHPGDDHDEVIEAAIAAKEAEIGGPIDRSAVLVVLRTIVDAPHPLGLS